MEPALLCTHASPAARTSSQADETDSISQSVSSETLANVSRCVHQEDSSGSGCVQTPARPSPDDQSRVCSCFSSAEAVLPLFPQLPNELTPPINVPDFKESIFSFSLEQDRGQTSTETPSGPSDKDAAPAPTAHLYIPERETQDFILCPHVAQEEFKGPSCDVRGLTCACEHMADHRCCRSSQGAVMLERESAVSQSITLVPPAGDACETARAGNEGSEFTPQGQRHDNRVELWLDACQHPAGEAPDDVLQQAGRSVLTRHLDFPPTHPPVSGYGPDAAEGIGCCDDDTVGRGPPVERCSSVDSWASALSDWTGIATALPEDLTAAFTEIGAEIDALTQALAEVNARFHRETSAEAEREEPAGQPRQVMGVQDQPVKPAKLPESGGQSCLPFCLQDGEGSQSIRMLGQADAIAQGAKEPEEQKSRRAELAPWPTRWRAATVTASGPVASTGGRETDGIPESLDPADVGPGGCDDRDRFLSNDEDPVILKIIEGTDLETARRELLPEQPNADQQFQGTEVCRRTSSPSGRPAEEESQRNATAVKGDPEGRQLHSFSTQSRVSDLLVPACPPQPLRAGPKFVTVRAPLCSPVSQTSSGGGTPSSARPALSCGHEQPCSRWPEADGIHVQPSLEGEALTPSRDTTKSAPPVGQLDLDGALGSFTERRTTVEDIHALSRELSSLAAVPGDRFLISEEKRLAVFTLDIDDPCVSSPLPSVPSVKPKKRGKADRMPHKSHRSSSESKARPKKDKPVGHQAAPQTSKKEDQLSAQVPALQGCKQQEGQILKNEKSSSKSSLARSEDKEAKPVPENTEKASNRPHGKKKKKHVQHAAGTRSAGESLAEVENGAKPKTTKGRGDMFEAKLSLRAGNTQNDSSHSCHTEKKAVKPEAKISTDQPLHHPGHKDQQPKGFSSPLNDEIKRRRLSGDKFGKLVGVLEPKVPKPAQEKREETKADGAAPQKAYSEVVQQKTTSQEEAKVVKPIQAEAVSGDPQSLCLWCQFSAVWCHHTLTWSRDGTLLSEATRSAGDESRARLTIPHASHKDLGRYQCRLASLQGSVSLDYLLTYEVLSEIVIPPPPKINLAVPAGGGEDEEEDVQCSRLLFKEDFLSTQYFGENQPVSIITEKVHFGEGMHRRAFRTKLHSGQAPLLLPGDSCVLKVHNSISHGTKNNEELIQRNFHLAVEECQVQSTAGEYLKAYTAAAQSLEAFGDIPEIIPIYLVHRPSNQIPYATLEEELIGDFVKYSVKDGKEINLMRRDSEAGQKCCAFQHWVYQQTEGNLLVTDMQGVGMKLTDVGIATTKKGYKGFKGNCATSFIDQFKVLHQCNKFCEILGLKSLQAKTKKPVPPLKSKPPPPAAPKKKTFGPTVKGKS